MGTCWAVVQDKETETNFITHRLSTEDCCHQHLFSHYLHTELRLRSLEESDVEYEDFGPPSSEVETFDQCADLLPRAPQQIACRKTCRI